MRDLSECRQAIDRIDTQVMELLMERQSVSADVAAYKAECGMPIFDPVREREKIQRATELVPDDLASYAMVLQTILMEASRDAQHRLLGDQVSIASSSVQKALSQQPAFFPLSAKVACQGVEGAYQQIATNRLFRRAQIDFCDTFEGVFEAVEAGTCEFGVLPVENSIAGTVNRVYDLMRQHDFHIVRSCRLKIDHNLLVKPGTSLDDIRIVYSHEQALYQCAELLQQLGDIRVHPCANTAKAAEKVAQADRSDVAAIASRDCASLYGLTVLRHSVQDKSNNYTRFACITKDLTIYPGADRASFMAVLNHEPGALYKTLAKFYALDVNLIKLESRPIPDRDFEFRFYFDVECPAAAPQFLSLVDSLADTCEEFRYLGSYSEVI